MKKLLALALICALLLPCLSLAEEERETVEVFGLRFTILPDANLMRSEEKKEGETFLMLYPTVNQEDDFYTNMTFVWHADTLYDENTNLSDAFIRAVSNSFIASARDGYEQAGYTVSTIEMEDGGVYTVSGQNAFFFQMYEVLSPGSLTSLSVEICQRVDLISGAYGTYIIASTARYEDKDKIETYCLPVIESMAVEGSPAWDRGGQAAGGWQKEGGNWVYYENGQKAAGWKKLDGKYYWFGADGVMQTGWKQIDGVWYCFSDAGVMFTGWQEIGGKKYCFAASGAMLSGAQEIDGKQYLFDDSGALRIGWLQMDDGWHYVTDAGDMSVGWAQVSGKWYYFSAAGVMQTGWNKIDGSWYYFGDNGVMATGRTQVDGAWEIFGDNGVWQKTEK